MWAAITNIIIGLSLMAFPELLNFDKTAANNNFVVAPIVITFAITALWQVNRSARWFNVVAGIWFIASPFVLGYDDQTAILYTVIPGIMITLLSFIKGNITMKYGGGWKSLIEEHPEHERAGASPTPFNKNN